MRHLRLNGTLGASYSSRGEEVLAMKTALKRLDRYRPPTGAIHEWPDTPLFESLTTFQKENGLAADGVAKPDGATETAVNAALAEQDATRKRKQPIFGVGGGVGAGQRNRGRDVQGTKRALAWAGYYPNAKAQRPDARPDDDLDLGLKRFQRDFGLKTDGFLRPGGETERTLDRVAGPLIDASVRPAFAYGSRVQEPPQPTLRPMPRGQADPGEQLYDAAAAQAGASPALTAQAAPMPPEGTPTEAADDEELIPVPVDKVDWFAVGNRREQWKNFQRSARALPGATDTEVEVYVELHAREGGMTQNPESSAFAGVMQNTLDGLINNGLVPGVEKGTKPSELNEEQIAGVYRAFFDDALARVDRHKSGHQVLQEIGDSSGAYALAESLFHFGAPDGTAFLQEAINTAASDQVLRVDGVMGPQTMGAYRNLLTDKGTRDRLLHAVADRLTKEGARRKEPVR